MTKFKFLFVSDEGDQWHKLNDGDLPSDDKYYYEADGYMDLTLIESINVCETRFNNQDCTNVRGVSGKLQTLVINTEELANAIIKAKQNKLIMN